MDQESFERLAAGHAKLVEAEYPWVAEVTPGANGFYKAGFRFLLGDHNQALELLINSHPDWPIGGEQWTRFLINPWFEDYRNHPELAAAIDQYEQDKARIADELREMVKRAEWQQ